MFCGKCGALLPDDADFCTSCGNVVKRSNETVAADDNRYSAPAVEEAAENNFVQPSEFSASDETTVLDSSMYPGAPAADETTVLDRQVFINEDDYHPDTRPDTQSGVQSYAPVVQPVTNAKGKKVKNKSGKKARRVLLPILGVIVLVAIVAAFFWQSIARAVLGDIGFYLWRESRTLTKVSGITDFLKPLGSKSFKSETTLEIDPESFDSSVAEQLTAYSPKLESSYSTKGKKGVVKLTINQDGERVTLLKVDYEKGNATLNVPMLAELMKDSGMDIGAEALDKYSFSTDGDMSSYKPLLKLLNKAFNKTIKKNTTVSSGDVNGKNCKIMTLKLDGSDLADMLDTLYTEFENDSKAQESVEKLLEYLYDSTLSKVPGPLPFGDSFEDFRDLIFDRIEETIDMAVDGLEDSDMKISFSVAYDMFGNVVNRTVVIDIDGEKLKIDADSVVKINEASLDIKATFDDGYADELFSASFKRTKSGGKTDMSFKATVEGDDVFVKAKELKYKKLNGVNVLTGTVTAGISNDDEYLKLDMQANGSYDILLEASDGYDIYKAKLINEISNKPDLSDFEAPAESKAFGGFLGLLPAVSTAVAVPMFSAVTLNGYTKACKANMRVIRGNVETYQMTGNNGEEVVFYRDTVLSETLPSEFVKLFDNNELPVCPKHGYPYYICVHVISNGLVCEVRCTDPDCPEHNQ